MRAALEANLAQLDMRRRLDACVLSDCYLGAVKIISADLCFRADASAAQAVLDGLVRVASVATADGGALVRPFVGATYTAPLPWHHQVLSPRPYPTVAADEPPVRRIRFFWHR